MDKALRRVMFVMGMLIVLLLGNITYLQAFRAEELRDDPLNPRRYADRFRVDRGSILADGERLAWSEAADDRSFRRLYREGPVFAPITGYYGTYSDSGLERAENDLLNGADPRLAVRNFVDRLVGRPIEGGSVETTVDPDAQRAAYAGLRAGTGLRGAVVALDVRTGAIKALASYPSYDPQALTGRAADETFERLQADTFRQPLLNKATDETFLPGSTFKAVVAAAALSGGVKPTGRVRAGPSYRPPGSTATIGNSHDSGGCGDATTSLRNAFAQSCNTTFAYLGAERLGNRAVGEQARLFGFGQRIEYAPNLSGAASRFPETGVPGTAQASIGQGDTRATPLQMAMIAAAAAGGGDVLRPYLVERVLDRRGRTVGTTRTRRLGTAMSADDARELRDMMAAVVRDGTADNLRGADVAGKTGTADVDGRAYNERWFIGFGPVEEPRYAVAVVTEGAGFGGTASGPIAVSVLRTLRNG